MQVFKYKAKLIVLGERNVGKTNLVCQFAKKEYKIGVSRATISLQIVQTQIQNLSLKIYDFPGSQNLLIPNYMRNTQIALIIYSNNELKSLERVKFWYQAFKQQNQEKNSLVIIVKNKVDLKAEEDRSLPALQKKIKLLGCPIVQTSLKDKLGIQQLKQQILKIRDQLSPIQEEPQQVILDLISSKKQNKQKPRNCAC